MKNKIKELTPAQVEQMAAYRDRALSAGLSADAICRDVEAARPAVDAFYKMMGRGAGVPIIFMDSPLSAGLAANLLCPTQVWAQVRGQVRDQVWDQARAQVRDQVEDQVWDQVRDQVWDQVEDQVWDQVRDQVWDQVGAQVRDQVWAQVRDQVEDQVWAQVRDRVVWPYLTGNFDHWWSGYYPYFRDVLKIKMTDFSVMEGLCDYGPIWPLRGWCVISDRPQHIKMVDGRLHNDGGPAILYRDGLACWSLNGVRVPQWLAETPAEEIDPLKFAEQDNAEVRREFVRKVGMERIIAGIDCETLDESGDYALLSVDLGGETGKWPYLKMRNPSIGVWHIECVEKECRTVQQAINFRASRLKSLGGKDWNPEVLS